MKRREGARAGHPFDVIIAGAGPVGLFLGCELGLAGVSVLVLERDATAASPWRAPGLGLRALNTAAVEAFYRRGLLDELFDPGVVAWVAQGTPDPDAAAAALSRWFGMRSSGDRHTYPQ